MQQLCFEVSSNALSYSIIDTESQSTIAQKSVSIKGRIDELKKEESANFLRVENLLEFNGEVSLSYSGDKVTLAPQMIFGESNAKAIFELCFGASNETIEHNRFFEQTLVVVYEIEAWIKRFFVVRYPRIVVQHDVTHILRGIFKQNTFEPVLHLAVNTDFFTLLLVEKNKIAFFNTFDFSSVEDLFYYSSHVWNNAQMKNKTRSIRWHDDNKNDELFNQFHKMHQDLLQSNEFRIERVSKIQHQLLCV
jgi:hypothetical protein